MKDMQNKTQPDSLCITITTFTLHLCCSRHNSLIAKITLCKELLFASICCCNTFVLFCCLARSCQEANPEDVPLYVFMETCQHDATSPASGEWQSLSCWSDLKTYFGHHDFRKKEATAAAARSTCRGKEQRRHPSCDII